MSNSNQMNMNRLVLVVIILVHSCNCIAQGYVDTRADSMVPFRMNTKNHVSIVQLLAHPEIYHGKLIIVEGFFHYKFENQALYLTVEHANYLSGDHAIWVTSTHPAWEVDSLESYDEKRVSIEGTFNMNHTGHLGCCKSALENVTRIFQLTKWFDNK